MNKSSGDDSDNFVDVLMCEDELVIKKDDSVVDPLSMCRVENLPQIYKTNNYNSLDEDNTDSNSTSHENNKISKDTNDDIAHLVECVVNKDFTENGNHLKRSFKCTICGRMSASLTYLSGHIRFHLGLKLPLGAHFIRIHSIIRNDKKPVQDSTSKTQSRPMKRLILIKPVECDSKGTKSLLKVNQPLNANSYNDQLSIKNSFGGNGGNKNINLETNTNKETKICSKVYHRNLRRHEIVSHNKRRHEIVSHNKRRHEIVSHNKRRHEIVSHNKRRHEIVSHNKRRHEIVSHNKKPFKCNECEKYFSQNADLSRHNILFHGEKIKCKICGKQFTVKSLLLRHQAVCQKLKLKCDKCDKYFTHNSHLKMHSFMQHMNKKFKCNKCPEFFSNIHSLIQHATMHTHVVAPSDNNLALSKKDADRGVSNADIGKCIIEKKENIIETNKHAVEIKGGENNNSSEISLKYSNVLELIEYIAIHSNIICEVCGKQFYKKSSLKQHKKMLCTGVDKERMDDSVLKELRFYKCKVCEKKYTDRRNIITHIKAHIGVKLPECKICGKQFHSQFLVNTHVTKVHIKNRTNNIHTKTSIKGTETNKPSNINKCSVHRNSVYSFRENKDSKYLKFEVHASEKKKTYKCEICSQEFNKMSNLKRHDIVSHNKEPFKCSICGKCFSLNSDLSRHNIESHGGASVKCEFCGFIVTSSLLQHQAVCKNLKLFKCDMCSKCFTHYSHLRMHLAIHNVKNNLQCNMCKKRFLQHCQLEKHMNDHKQFICKKCLKIFYNIHNLIHHMTTHNIVEPTNGVKDPSEADFGVRVKDEPQVDTSDSTIKASVTSFENPNLNIENINVNGDDPNLKTSEHMTQTNDGYNNDPSESMLKIPNIVDLIEFVAADSNIICEVCGKQFYKKSSLKQHKKMLCTGVDKECLGDNIVKKLRYYKCKVCEKKYTARRNIIPHVKAHIGIILPKCKYCGKQFQSQGFLKMHMTKDHIETSKTSVVESLQDHTSKVNAPTKALKCMLCDEDFFSEHSLQIHVDKHFQ